MFLFDSHRRTKGIKEGKGLHTGSVSMGDPITWPRHVIDALAHLNLWHRTVRRAIRVNNPVVQWQDSLKKETRGHKPKDEIHDEVTWNGRWTSRLQIGFNV